MKKFLSIFLFLLAGSVYAQIQTSPNVVGTTVSPAPAGVDYNWTGFTVTNSTGGGFAGGNQPGYNSSTGQFMFGYTQGTIAYSMAINSALSGSGLQINGIEYGLTYYNQNDYSGTLSVGASILSPSGETLQSYNDNLPQTTNGWTQWDQTKIFSSPYSLASVGNARLTFTGKDSRFWAGYYGPQFKDPYLRFNYTADICASDPLSNASCPGYAAAYLTQQCSINPLHDPSCPGYTTAQCTINPLFSQSCPGYQSAYLAQQCTLDSLYSTSCPDYAAAYAKKNVLGISSTSSTSTVKPKSEPSTTVSSDGKVETQVSTTGDSNVDKTIESKSSVTPSATAPVQLAPSQGGQGGPNQVAQQQKPEPKQGSNSQEQPAPKSVRAERAERAEARANSNEGKPSAEIKRAANEKARDEMKKAQTATTFESQVAVQQNVIGAMGFVPGFASYAQANVPDLLQKQLQRQYGKDVVDNRNAGRRLFGGSDRLHEEMVNQQYR